MNHTWLYKKILEKFSSYQEFAKAIDYQPQSAYAFIVAYQIPSDGSLEKISEVLGIKVEEVRDYMSDDFDTNKKHRTMTGENYFTAKLVVEEINALEVSIVDSEKGGEPIKVEKMPERKKRAYSPRIKKESITLNREPQQWIIEMITEIEKVVETLDLILFDDVLQSSEKIDFYQNGIRRGLAIAKTIIGRGMNNADS